MSKTAAITTLTRLAIRAYRRDRANRYELQRDWTIEYYSNPRPPAPYRSRLVVIVPIDTPRPGARITIKAPGECDGATGVPDSPPGAVEASIAHDPLYIELRAIARHWRRVDSSWDLYATRKWIDGVLAAIMSYYGSHLLRHVYYRGARWLGGIFDRVKHLLPVLILPIIIVGCDVPDADDIRVPDDPIWEKVADLPTAPDRYLP